MALSQPVTFSPWGVQSPCCLPHFSTWRQTDEDVEDSRSQLSFHHLRHCSLQLFKGGGAAEALCPLVGVCSPVCVRIGMELRRERYREQMRNLNARPWGGKNESFYVRRSVLMTASCPVRSTHTSFAVDR
ncbi:unnamed protein product [Pleuronectes platessa]|uniref:Uncharacterized protein n=1 Tax=Pleuronectes platessa TaxID=8262 RepID=A0A9N7UF02_PLEPL|nr:unnamed protein product [Pleuronectes platessa]